jgi:hypothetical protein
MRLSQLGRPSCGGTADARPVRGGGGSATGFVWQGHVVDRRERGQCCYRHQMQLQGCRAGRRSEGVDVEALADRLVAAALLAQGQLDVNVLLESGAVLGDGRTTSRHCAPAVTVSGGGRSRRHGRHIGSRKRREAGESRAHKPAHTRSAQPPFFLLRRVDRLYVWLHGSRSGKPSASLVRAAWLNGSFWAVSA